MCKHVVLIPVKTDSALPKQGCLPLPAGAWRAGRRALSLHHTPAQQFARCQWQTGHRPATAYLIYRWLLLIFIVSVGISSFACQRLPKAYEGTDIKLNYFKWFIYFTNWGFIFIAVQAALAVAVVHYYRSEKNLNIREADESPLTQRARTPPLVRCYWLTHIIATDLALVITLVYWTLVHDPKIHEVNAQNLLVHGGNSIVMLVELAVTAHPLRFAHALYGAGAGMAYGVFSALYWACGGTDRIGQPAIYPTLDWNKPAMAFGFVALCAVVLVSAHALAALLAAARARLAAHLGPARAHTDRLTLPTH